MAMAMKMKMLASRLMMTRFISLPPAPIQNYWTKAAHGYTLNVDASWQEDTGEIWVGEALRDEDDQFLHGCAQKDPKKLTIEYGKAKSCHQGMEKYNGFKNQRKITLFCDNYTVVNWINVILPPPKEKKTKEKDNTDLRKLLTMISTLKKQCAEEGTEFTVEYVRKRWNKIAHNIVKYAIDNNQVRAIYKSPPSELASTCLNDDKESRSKYEGRG